MKPINTHEVEADSVVSLQTLETWLAATVPPEFRYSSGVRDAVSTSHQTLKNLMRAGVPIYGTSTGFGPFVRFDVAHADTAAHAIGLLEHLGAGAGPAAPASVVRAAMIIRLHTLGKGFSGVSPKAIEGYMKVFNSGCVPFVPQMGSLGASGDLVPLAHIARVLAGRGRGWFNGSEFHGLELNGALGISPVELESRDALGLVNGTAFSTAYTAVAAIRCQYLLDTAEALTAQLYRLLGARQSHLHPALHEARGQRGQITTAANIRRMIEESGGYEEDTCRQLQEIYSLRCAPQVLGAVRQQLDSAIDIIEQEINGVDDNPLILPADREHPHGQAIHGGNFHAQQIAFAADMLNAATTQIAVLVERQIDLILNPQHNKNAPLLLAYNPGLNSGMAGAQITATAILSEIRGRNSHYATSSIPTNGGNQDIVPMAAAAGRAAYDQTEYAAPICSVLALCIRQLNFLREIGKADGHSIKLPDTFPSFKGMTGDRALHDDIERVAKHILSGHALHPAKIDSADEDIRHRSASNKAAPETSNPWKPILFERFRGAPYPLVTFDETTIPAASLWAGSRIWVDAMRDAGLSPGSRLLCALQPSPAWLQVLLACLWNRMTFIPVPASSTIPADVLENADPHLVIGLNPEEGVVPELETGYIEAIRPEHLRETRCGCTEDVRFILATSGSTGDSKWVALSDENILSVIDAHKPLLNLGERVVLSILPWHHSFGLIIELLPALLSGAQIVRDGTQGRNTQRLLELAQTYDVDHMSCVPLTVKQLAATPEGSTFLQALQGGIVGGAPVDEESARILSETRLRVGYGQTEASPGICLGNSGKCNPVSSACPSAVR